MKIQTKAEQQKAIDAAVKGAKETLAKVYGPETQFYGTQAGKYPFKGQAKAFGLLMGAYTLGVLNAAGYFVMGKDDKVTKGKGKVCGRAFEVLCSGAFDHWTKSNAWATSEGLTEAGLQMVQYRLGQIATAPTKTGSSTGKTSASLVRDFAEIIVNGPSKTGEAHIKDAMMGVKFYANTFGKFEPFAADRK